MSSCVFFERTRKKYEKNEATTDGTPPLFSIVVSILFIIVACR